jgi:predicted glycogen debranching enzyme
MDATGHFLVRRPGGRSTIIAGYPWFGDWGRDTFIALPGICLVTGRLDAARDILRTYARYVDRGMIPNRFPDDADGEAADYNSVDASLWYVHAIGRYLAASDDRGTLEVIYPAVREILEGYAAGTRHCIGVAADGLLAAGEPGVQLTWMDAKVGDHVVTPRIGKPVEINALWFNALRTGADLATRLNATDDASRWRGWAEACRVAFNARFWNEAAACLFDVVDRNHEPGRMDDAIRPNQLLAISLPHAVLDESRWKTVVDVARAQLLTPMGMRTLSPGHADYRGRYEGDGRSRDTAYHQGTAWAWLLGPMISGWVRAYGGSAAARREARGFLDGLAAHVGHGSASTPGSSETEVDDRSPVVMGLGGVCEVADGDPPHRPGGCPWQAWSVAEPLRGLLEDIYLS